MNSEQAVHLFNGHSCDSNALHCTRVSATVCKSFTLYSIAQAIVQYGIATTIFHTGGGTKFMRGCINAGLVTGLSAQDTLHIALAWLGPTAHVAHRCQPHSFSATWWLPEGSK